MQHWKGELFTVSAPPPNTLSLRTNSWIFISSYARSREWKSSYSPLKAKHRHEKYATGGRRDSQRLGHTLYPAMWVTGHDNKHPGGHQTYGSCFLHYSNTGAPSIEALVVHFQNSTQGRRPIRSVKMGGYGVIHAAQEANFGIPESGKAE